MAQSQSNDYWYAEGKKNVLYVKLKEVVFVMEKKRQKASTLDYTALCELARSRNIKFVEA